MFIQYEDAILQGCASTQFNPVWFSILLYALQHTVYDQGEAVLNDEIQYWYCTILPKVTHVTPDYARKALTNKGVDINALIYYFIFLYIAIYGRLQYIWLMVNDRTRYKGYVMADVAIFRKNSKIWFMVDDGTSYKDYIVCLGRTITTQRTKKVFSKISGVHVILWVM